MATARTKAILCVTAAGMSLVSLTGTGSGKDKKQIEPSQVYDHTAKIEWRAAHPDAEYHVSTDEGSLSLYCSQYGSSTECSTRKGDGWWVTFDDGSHGFCCDLDSSESNRRHETPFGMKGDPLRDLTNSLIDDNRVAHSGSFKYRVGKVYKDGSGTFCVPDNKTDKKGRVMVGEACYGTIFIRYHH